MKPALYVPDAYVPHRLDDTTLWTHADAPDRAVAPFIGPIVAQALQSVTHLLAFQRTRALHVVVYDSLDDSRCALGRDLSPTFLLAPLHTRDSALIALHSPRLDPKNADPRRMLRQLCHEVSHVCAAERTESVKRLGDGDVGMRLRPWVDEGFAVCVAAHAAEQPDTLGRVPGGDPDAGGSMDVIDDELRALDSPRRSWAFGVATVRVWAGIERHGFRFVFHHLHEPERWS